MKRTLLIALIASLISVTASAQTKNDELLLLKDSLSVAQSKHVELEKKVRQLSMILDRSKQDIQILIRKNESLCDNIDSLKSVCNNLKKIQTTDKVNINSRIQDANNMIISNRSSLERRTIGGCVSVVVILVILFFIYYLLTKRIKTGTSSIDEVRKAQEALQSAQTKMQEESVKLDSQLLAIVQRQIDATSHTVNNAHSELDHSLVVKLADEIARIETNLSKMDKSVKGYKQLVQAKDRMINNVRANGYEIISLLGQEYNDGMQFPTRFVPDESLPEGKRIITGMIKMQVNYNGKMIQPAEIVVSQNI